MARLKGLTARQFYALIWKDFVVHKRHYIWTMLEITIPVLVCAMAILSNTHQGKAKLENERTFDPDDYERLYGELNPQRHKLLVAPNTSFTRALIDQIDDGAVSVEFCNTESELVDLIKKEIPVSLDQIRKLLPDDSANVTIGGVVIESDESMTATAQINQTTAFSEKTTTSSIDGSKKRILEKDSYYYEVISKLDGKLMKIPINFHMSIRAKDFRLGPEAFPKKNSLGPFLHSDHYTTTFFMASQIMLSRAYMNLLVSYMNTSDIVIPTNDDIIGQRMPYPKYVAHRRLKETTLGTFVAGSQKQKPFVLTMDYCITVGFLVTAIFLAKRIVDERKSRVRDMLRLVGISDWTYYGSHMSNTMLIMTLQCALITLLFTGHTDAPAQNIDSTLLFVILLLYCLASVMFVLALSTLFNSSTKAIIFTSLLWLGLPEVLDRIFKLNSGVIESNGFIAVGEHVHLLFCLMPNFALRLMNRLLTECDIYGEFYAKKQLYAEYQAIWPNIFTSLPLYKWLTLAYIMFFMILSVPFYAIIIYLINSSSSISLTGETRKGKSSSSSSFPLFLPISWLVNFVINLIIAPFKLVHQLLFASESNHSSGKMRNSKQTERASWSVSNLNQAGHDVVFIEGGGKVWNNKRNHQAGDAAYLNSGYTHTSLEELSENGAKKQILNCDDLDSIQEQQKCPITGNDPKYFEASPKMLNIGVSIRNLSKTYLNSSSKVRRIEAVKNISLDMFYSQILVLLGHNGAGKTTLIDIISGHNQKSSGKIYIDGHDIDTHPTEARRRVGFCPQFDVLFERLTVEEHLYFYGIVKGARKELKREMEELLQQSGLDVHRRKLSKALSGGYKRKLSLAIAMIAQSKVLILDEPTSGMDPESRRKVWDFLQLIRRDRLILMTTHHMEEADALGDRIAVMSGGQVKCCGSALFLKKVFNAGYHLRISKSSNWNQSNFDELIGNKYKLREKLENITPHELMYKFDADQTSNLLPPLFDDLERYKEKVGIFGFGVTVSTMDDVFMKIGLHFKDIEAEEMQSKFEQANQMTTQSGIENGNSSNNKISGQSASSIKLTNYKSNGLASMRKERLEGSRLFKQQVRALLAKRYQHACKNWFQLLWILSISLACVASIVILIDLVIFKEELLPEWSHEMTLKGAGYGEHTQGIYQFAPLPVEESVSFSASDTTDPPANTGSTSSTTSTTTTTTSTSTTTSTTTTTTLPPSTITASATTIPAAITTTAALSPTTTISSPVTSEAASATTGLLSTTTDSSNGGEPLTLTTTALSTPTTTTADSLPPSTAASLERRRRGGRIRRQTYNINDNIKMPLNDSALFLAQHWLPEARKSGIGGLLTYTDINSEMVDLLTSQFANFRENYVVGGEKAGKKYVAWYSGEATHSFPISMNIMLNSILKQITDLIQDNGHPLKGSRISLKHEAMAQINTLIAFLPHLGRLINLVFLPFSLAFITSYFVIFPTHERVTKSKHLQLMTGVPARTFWLSHFLFDLLLYSAYTISLLAIYFVWDRVINDRRIYFANFEHSLALIALVTLFIFGALPLAYIFSFLAKKPTSAFSSFCVLTILTGTATLTLVSLYELKYEHNASTTFKTAFTIFLWSARLIPSVSLLVGLQKLFSLNTTRSICINVSPEVLELLCRYINSPLVDDELRVLKPERCCKAICQDECYDQLPFHWTGWFGINVELAMLIFDAILFWLILVIIESRSIRGALWRATDALQPFKWAANALASARSHFTWQVPQFVDDKELRQEQLRIESIVDTNRTGQYSLVAASLSKVYAANQFKAVDQLSFAVEKSEFFGLLGVNGAGKSTTFKMLTGELQPSGGNAWIGAYDVLNQRTEFLKRIGYCPQQDALIDNLTGAEMLALFARLRGLPERLVEQAVEESLERLGLSRIGQVNCNNYSGGNKRRLSVGMALIGAPEVIFLDEPTSGVDPRSRRRLWSTLIEFQQQTKSAIVMTSHSMNECECLCDRVAIMVAGQFKVLGSIQYLRTKLSQGFSLLLKLKPDNLKQIHDLTKSSELIHDYMQKTFSSSEIQLKDLHQTVIQYHIQPNEQLTWSRMLVQLEKAKVELDLEDYQITSDASLESIFLSLAKQEENN